jgi:diadenylate cyclase
MRILIGIFSFYLIWLLVKAMKMELIATILGQIMGVGMIALIIVFQQEVRRFLLILGNRYFKNNKISGLFRIKHDIAIEINEIDNLSKACQEMSEEMTGALIVISKGATLRIFGEQGEIINADISAALIKSIFFRDNPLHDGAILIENNKISAAKCILPVSENPEIPKKYGLRHRSAVGITELADCFVIVVSEQTGDIAIANNGTIFKIKNKALLKTELIKLLKE